MVTESPESGELIFAGGIKATVEALYRALQKWLGT